jgi:hypothetical protein
MTNETFKETRWGLAPYDEGMDTVAIPPRAIGTGQQASGPLDAVRHLTLVHPPTLASGVDVSIYTAQEH